MAGVVASFIDDNDEYIEPPDIICTPMGAIVVILIVTAILIDFLICLCLNKITLGKFEVTADTSLLEKVVSPSKKEIINDWLENKGLMDSLPTFYEEYIYYKFYYKILGILYGSLGSMSSGNGSSRSLLT